MKIVRVLEQDQECDKPRIVEHHDVTYLHPSEATRLRATLELAYNDDRYVIEEAIVR